MSFGESRQRLIEVLMNSFPLPNYVCAFEAAFAAKQNPLEQ